MTRATNTYTTPRRAVLRGLLAAPLAAAPLGVALAAPQAETLSPRLAVLKLEWDPAAAHELHLRNLPPEGYDDAWQEAWDELSDLALKILQEPVHGAADWRFKVAVWQRHIYEPKTDGDELIEDSHWMDKVPFRLLSDARRLIGEG